MGLVLDSSHVAGSDLPFVSAEEEGSHSVRDWRSGDHPSSGSGRNVGCIH